MKTKDLIKIIKNQEFNHQTAQLLKQELEKYPYFTPLLVTYLLCLKAIDENLFKEQLTKYSIYISNRHDFIKKLIQIDYLKQTNKLSLKPGTDQNLDKELYETAKKHHQQIVNEIIEPKIEKLRKLSELSKTQKTLQQTVTPDTKTQQKQQPQEQTTASEKITETPQPTEPSEKTAQTPEQQQTSQTQQKQKTKSEISIDDIFKKIEELKKQKLQAVSDYQKRVTTVDKLIEEKKVREDIEKQQDKGQTQTQQPEKSTEKQPEDEKSRITETQQTTQKVDIDRQAQEEITNLIEFESSETTRTTQQSTQEKTEPEAAQSSGELNKTQTKPQEQTQQKQQLKPESDKHPETEQKTAQPPTGTFEQQTAKKTPEQITKTSQTTKKTGPEQKPTTQQPETTEKTTQQQKIQPEQPAKPESQQPTTTPSTQHKTAADRILEQIAKRRQERKKKQQELIDKFLEEQPSIDRTKQPSIDGDLSEPHTKEVEIVTENMAKIYELQGLYEKAIETYEKLILQKPEKKDYFADKIKQLKQKLNN